MLDLIENLQNKVDDYKEQLCSRLVESEQTRYLIGIIHGIREAIEEVKEQERLQNSDNLGEPGWETVGEKDAKQR